MRGPTAKAQNIPKRQREQLAAPLLKLVRQAFEDPRTAEDFEKWREERRKTTENKKPLERSTT